LLGLLSLVSTIRTMVDWDALLADDDAAKTRLEDDDEWRQEAADSVSELYYETYRSQKKGARIDLRAGSDSNKKGPT